MKLWHITTFHILNDAPDFQHLRDLLWYHLNYIQINKYWWNNELNLIYKIIEFFKRLQKRNKDLWQFVLLTDIVRNVSLGGSSTCSVAWKNPGKEGFCGTDFQGTELNLNSIKLEWHYFIDENKSKGNSCVHKYGKMAGTDLFIKLGLISKQQIVKSLRGALFNVISPTRPWKAMIKDMTRKIQHKVWNKVELSYIHIVEADTMY